MTRISPSKLRNSLRFSPLLPPLVKSLRDVRQAQQELRWIQSELPKSQWVDAVIRRSFHEPLQYILGSQPFGELDIRCKPHVLIPRWETEEWVSGLCKILQNGPGLKILDACTGTGCIPLLMYHKLKTWSPQISAFDISDHAIDLSNENLESYRETYGECSVRFFKQDISSIQLDSAYDIITSNPPYIPEYDFNVRQGGVGVSVKKYEPPLALVGDVEFYTDLVNRIVIPSQARGFMFELGYEHQADHVDSLLDSSWSCGKFYDSQNNIRCVVGSKKNTDIQLTTLCNELYLR